MRRWSFETGDFAIREENNIDSDAFSSVLLDNASPFLAGAGEVRLTIPATALEPSTPLAPNPAGLTREFFPKLSGDSLLDLTSMPDFYRPSAVKEECLRGQELIIDMIS